MKRKLGRHHGNYRAKQRKLYAAVNRVARPAALTFTLCVGVTSAFAADLPAPALMPRPAYAPPPYDWTGFYVGGNLGAGWSGLSNTNFSDTLGSSFTGPTNTQFVGGAQVGANYQFWGGVVIGAEAMFDWFAVSHNNPVTATDPTNTVAANIGPVDARWATTITGKLGYAWDRVLLYAKGGGAWVATTSPSISIAGGGPASFSSVNNTTASTWTAGFGLEWAFSGNWSVRAEYDYIALPNQSLTVAPATPTFGGDVISFNNRNLSIFTAALNYKFGGW
jgi:outer membrane immunogenic protein